MYNHRLVQGVEHAIKALALDLKCFYISVFIKVFNSLVDLALQLVPGLLRRLVARFDGGPVGLGGKNVPAQKHRHPRVQQAFSVVRVRVRQVFCVALILCSGLACVALMCGRIQADDQINLERCVVLKNGVPVQAVVETLRAQQVFDLLRYSRHLCQAGAKHL